VSTKKLGEQAKSQSVVHFSLGIPNVNDRAARPASESCSWILVEKPALCARSEGQPLPEHQSRACYSGKSNRCQPQKTRPPRSVVSRLRHDGRDSPQKTGAEQLGWHLRLWIWRTEPLARS
jgi:hypothetical protein